ncbi:uncharacterized [Tachysurus ichikawai]
MFEDTETNEYHTNEDLGVRIDRHPHVLTKALIIAFPEQKHLEEHRGKSLTKSQSSRSVDEKVFPSPD